MTLTCSVCLLDHLHSAGRQLGPAPGHLPLPGHHGRLHPGPQHPHRPQRVQDLSCGQGGLNFIFPSACFFCVYTPLYLVYISCNPGDQQYGVYISHQLKCVPVYFRENLFRCAESINYSYISDICNLLFMLCAKLIINA